MKTIRTAAYAADAATTSNGRWMVAVDMIATKTTMKPVMIPNRFWLPDALSSHHSGASSMISPINMRLVVPRVSKISLLEYLVAAD
jgi:formate hydrogenlyase subunit 3/multisubunit Na+/H+ antiporter MnhD subunit